MRDWLPTFRTAPLVERSADRDRSLSSVVVETVALVSTDRIEDLPPLYDAVDPDLLDAAFERRGPGLVAFRYAGYVVSVTADRTVAVYDD